MKKNLVVILFLVLLFPLGKEVIAQATCEGTITAGVLGDFGAGTQLGDGTAGYIKVCIVTNSIGSGSCMGVSEGVVVSPAIGSGGNLFFSDATADGTCYTYAANTGYGWLSTYCWSGAGDAVEFTWETVDALGVNVCPVPTCSDGILNQDETAIDCGGTTCPPCGAASCIDGVQNQDETGIDCGGVCPVCVVASDNCSDAPTVAADSTCTSGTTVGATDSWSGTVGCQSADGSPDVWFAFTATGSNTEITVENGTMTGDVEIILVTPSCPADDCSCTFSLIGSSCGASPNTGIFNTIAGENYYYTVSSSTGSQGTFTSCVESNNDVTPGQDCNTAQALCSDGGFTVGNIQNGTGAVNESSWLSCASEQNTQWYTFSATVSGTFSAMIQPTNWNGTTSDDYDFAMLDITASGCTAGATTELACDFSPCRGSTGFSATGAAGFAQVAGTDYNASGSCNSGPQWNTNAVTLTAGNTYAYMIQNYTGSTGGATVTFGGTASMTMDASFVGILAADCYSYSTVLNSLYTGANWTYLWDFGDGTGTSTLAQPSYVYTTDGTYNVSFTMTNSVGCVATGSASVTTGCVLPISLNYFSTECNDEEVKLSWSTSSEINNVGFTIQRSSDGKTFKNIGEVNGGGTSSSLLQYSFVDEKPLRQGSYYRLKQTDFDGKSSYSQIVKVDNCGDYGITVLPNPSKGVFNIFFDSDKLGDYKIVVFDITGKRVISKNINVENKNDKTYSVDITNFEKGIYIMNVSNETGSINLKIVTE